MLIHALAFLRSMLPAYMGPLMLWAGGTALAIGVRGAIRALFRG